MKSFHKSNHIYTFVLTSRKTAIIYLLGLSVVMLIICSSVFYTDSNCYTYLYDTFSRKLKLSSPDEITKEALTTIKPDAELFTQTAVPVLSQYIKFEKTNNKKNHTAQKTDSTKIMVNQTENKEKNPETPKAKVTEKNIISKNLQIKNETSYEIKINELKNSAMAYNEASSKARILILHTHGCESYMGSGYGGTYRNTDDSRNMIKIGEKLAMNLTVKGIQCIHDKTKCDYPSYNKAYQNSLEVANNHIGANPDIGFVFDIHRDAVTDENNNPVKLTYDYNGKKAAQIMIVCGTDELGLPHPDWRENLILALKLQEYLENTYPGVARPLNIRRERFNMHTTKGSLIFEIGSHGNTMDEALLSVDILSDAIAAVIGK